MIDKNKIRCQAFLIRDSVRNVSSERRRVSSFVENGVQWWKGKGGEAFRQEYKEIDDDAGRFLKHMNNTADGLERLVSLISRAERERATKEVAKR